MRTRRDLKKNTDEQQTHIQATETVEEKETDAKEEEDIDIDLEDPEVQKATEKIQAGYKGMRTRRELKQKEI